MNDEELWEKERTSTLYQKFKSLFSEDDVFFNNEVKANTFAVFCLVLLEIVLVISYVLVLAGVFEVPIHKMNFILCINIPLMLISTHLAHYYRYNKWWIKYLLCAVSMCVCFGLCSVLRIFVTLIICIPILLSTRYYSRKFTIFVSLASIAAYFTSEVIYALNEQSLIDLNLVTLQSGTTLTNVSGLREAVLASNYSSTAYFWDTLRGSFLPNVLLFLLISNICIELARRAHEMVLEQEEVTIKNEGMQTELKMATQIQTAVLPKIFPAFPRPEVDIYASMNPAKEVGGDFYDYYFIDDDHLVFVIADVSGKGVPAALFMMITKALIKTYASVYNEPGKIASEVNKQLCEEEDVDMFVTAWIGILEISTGIVTAVDCGHEYPLLSHQNGDYEIIKRKKSFVLGGMDFSKFHEYTFEMDPGDTIFLYTDGVPEATNKKNVLYGMTRLQNVLNLHKNDKPVKLLNAVKEDVDHFVQDADQFDDITMVALRLNTEEDKKLFLEKQE